MLRALARRPDFAGKANGVDQSPAFIGAARRFAQAERFVSCAAVGRLQSLTDVAPRSGRIVCGWPLTLAGWQTACVWRLALSEARELPSQRAIARTSVPDCTREDSPPASQ